MTLPNSLAVDLGADCESGGTSGTNSVSASGEDLARSVHMCGGRAGYLNAGTEVTVVGAPATSEQLASTSIDLKKLNITDGMKIKWDTVKMSLSLAASASLEAASCWALVAVEETFS